MRANYHTHTWRCNHAEGTEKEYVEAALENGFEILGFSDHSPYVFPGIYYSFFRMRMDQFDDYVQTILSLKEEYKDRIQIHLGLELEYYPKYLPKLLPILQDSPVEYVILGQHYLGNEITPLGMEPHSGAANGDKTFLERYVNQSIEAMNTGLFTYVAHPDLVCFRGEESWYDQQMRRLCREAKSCDLPLEINLWGAIEKRHYPTDRFWQIAAEENCKVILGRDAHNSQCFYDGDTLKRGMDIVEKYGLNLQETAVLRPLK